MVSCIILDCDGTLVDSEHLGNRVLCELLAAHGMLTSTAALLQEFRGGKLSQIINVLETRHNMLLPSSFVANYRLLLELEFELNLQACAGVKEVLSELDLPLCVASNAPLAKSQKSLAITDLQGYFGDRIFSAYAINAWKPQPDLFLHAAANMRVEPAHCLVVEDSQTGVDAALAAGMHTVLIDASDAHAERPGVHCIDSMWQLPKTLARINC